MGTFRVSVTLLWRDQLGLWYEGRSSKYVCILNWTRGEADQEAVVPRTGKPGLVDPFRYSRVTEWVRMLF